MELADAYLAKHPQCPKNGFQVTVYGISLDGDVACEAPTGSVPEFRLAA